MRHEPSVQHKLKQIIYRYLQKRMRDNFKRKPLSCKHNRRFGDNDVGVCGFKKDGVPRASLCDDRYGGDPPAKDCPWFEARQSKADIKAEFKAMFEQDNRGLIAAAFPDVAALLWVLDPEEDAVLREALGATLEQFEKKEEEEGE